MTDKHIFYELNGERYKIPTEKKGDFERMAPTAKVMMTFKGENYGVPLTEVNSFVNSAGAKNVTYSEFDEKKKYSPDDSTLGYFEAVESPSADLEETEVAVAAEMPEVQTEVQEKPDSTFLQRFGESMMMSKGMPMNEAKPEKVEPVKADADIEDAIFSSHAEHKKSVDDYIARVDAEYNADKPAKGFLQRLGESLTRAQDEMSQGASSFKMEERREAIEKGRDYRDAKIAQNISDKVDDKIKQYQDPAKTFAGGVVQGFGDTVLDLDTWDSTIGANQAARVYAISKKLDKGESLTEGEQMIVDALVDDLASDMYLASGFGRGYKAGRVTGESLPFMLETMANPASGLGESITKKFGKEIFKQVSKKLGKTMAKAAVYGTRVAGDIAGASIMSATTSQPRVVADALDRLTGEVDFNINEDGTLGFDGFVGGEDSALKAYAKAFGSNAIEHYSEMIGNYFSPIGKMTKKGVANLADKIGAKKIKSLLTEMTPNGFGALLGDFAEQTQWHGTIGEFAEEMISGALNALVIGDQTLKKYDENGNLNQNYLFEKENMIDTFLGVAILGGVMSTAKTLGYTTPEARFNKAISDAKAGLEGVVSEEEMKQLEAFASNPMGADYANLDPFFDKSREEGYKRAVGRYVAAIMEKQGYNIAKSADLSGTKQGMNELMNAYRVGQNMSEADLYDVTDAEAKAQQALVDSGFLDAAGEDGADIMQQTLGYSSYDLFTLADKLERDNGIVLDDKQRVALKNLAVIKNAREGLENKLNGYTRMAIAANDAVSNGAAKDGILTVGFHNGKKVYVKGGVKVSNGSISKPSDITSYPVEIVDSMTGEATTVESGELSNVENIDLAVYNKNMADAITNAYNLRWEGWRNTKSAKSKLAEVEKFVGQKVFINTPDGKMAEVEVQQILPNGEVLIKGKKGDLGQQNLRVDADSFYDSMSRDADGNPIFNQSEFRSQSANIKAAQDKMYALGQQGSNVSAPTNTTPAVPVAEEAPATAPETEVEVTEEDDFRGLVAPILINGIPVEVEVVSQDGPSDTIVYEYEDENGNTKRGKTTIGGFKTALDQAKNYQPETPTAETPTAETPAAETPVAEEPEVPVAEEAPEVMEPTAEEIDWDALFAQDPEVYFAELQNQFGDKTATMLNAVITATQSELEALGKAKPKTQNEIFANEAKKEELQAKIDILNGMVTRLTAAEAPAAPEVAPEVPETPAAPEVVPEDSTPESETPEPQPIAPNPVDNPTREAQKKEKALATQLMRYDLTHELKQDLAFKAGKAVADFFATREEYEVYAENATDLGEYNDDFERGVDESFANRPQNTGNSPVNSVPLGTEPKGENNGESGEEDGTSGNGPSAPDNSGGSTNEGAEGGDQTAPKVGKGKTNKGKAGKKVADKYPARKGNATQKLLVDTFGFNKVEIPNSRKETLNKIYDFMMAMSKMLGISPKSIGQGGWLDVGSLMSNAQSSAEHSLISKVIDQSVVKATLKYKYAKLKGLAHEWWHALDHALSYFETGKGKITASEIPASRFTGRQETWYAVNQVIKAIKDSGHESRMFTLGLPRRYVDYLVEPTEMAARAFEEYMKAKFAAAGIVIDNAVDTDYIAQPTAEEMAVITPAFDSLFNVLQEKEGKTPGTSVLYHIGEEMEPQSDDKKLATEAILTALDDGNRDVEILSDEQAEQYLKMIGADPETQFSIDTDNPIFLSNAAIAVQGIKQEKATPEQWLKMIEKNGGLKAGEDKWMGLSDWLKASDKKTLTKQEVLDFIKENTIQIEEVNYGEIDFIKEDKKQTDAIQKEFDEIANSFMDQGYTIKHSYFLAFDKMKDKYGDDFSLAFDMYDGVLFVNNRDAASSITGIEYSGKGINETRLGYTTNGLTNLKEIAIVVPTIEAWNEEDDIHFGDAGDGRAVAWVRFGETSAIVEDANYVRLQEIYDRLNELESKVASEGITMEEYEERERLREERDSIPESRSQRVLVIDEIQSKRHQEGREHGYKVSREKADAEMEKFMDQMHSKYEFTSSTPFVEVFNEDEMREYARLSMQQHRATFGTTNIPDAPFDKNWSELAMKRMLRYAAENGYDAIAWTKGAQQAERYDIGQSVKTIEKGREYDNGTRYTLYDNSDTGRSIFVKDGIVTDAYFDELQGKPLSEAVGKEMADAMLSMKEGEIKDTKGMIGGEGMKGFYDKMLPAFMNKYGKKWGIKVADITLPNVEEAGRVMHSVPVNDAMRESVMEGQPMFYKTPNGTVYGWTDGKKIYLTKAGLNPNTPIHEYTHLWAKAMMLRNPKGWESIKKLLNGTPVWNEVINDPNYSNIRNNEDAVASEALSRISGSENAAKMEQMAQKMIDEAKGTGRKLEARGLIQNMRDALNKFWEFVWKDLFKMTYFRNVEYVTDRVLFDLLNNTDLGTLSEGQVEAQIVTDPKVIAELEASPKRTGYRNVVQNEDGTFSSPMAYWLQSTKGGAKTRVETAKFELGKWEEAEEHPELVDENGHVTLVKPNKSTVEVAYDPYIHNRLDPVNLQFKDAWKREELVYVETEVPETDLESGYHADAALLPVGVHSWSNGDLMLSKYDKPVRIMPWEDVADAWVERLNGEGVHFDVVPPALRPLLVERGVEILPPHKGMGKDCNDAYKQWKDSISNENSVSLPNISQAIESAVWDEAALNELNKITEDVEEGKAILKRYTSSELTGLLEGGRLLVGASIISRGSERNVSASRGRAKSLEGKAAETIPSITAWAKSIGAWRDYSERTEEEIAHSYITSGGEAQVFYLGNGKVEKIISLDYFVDPQLAVDRIAIHNSLFEETQLKVTGFGTNKDGKFAIIVEQPTIIGKHTDNSEIDSYIESIGFNKVDDATRTFANEEIYLSDLHEENVLNQNHERYYVIDGDFRLNTPEAGIGGTREIDDSIVRDNNDIRYRKADVQNAAVDYLVGEPRLRAIENAVNEEAAKLGVKVTYKTREQMPEGHKNDKGYYNTSTGEIVICTENASSINDAIQTILHEAVAHKGLRALMGDKFNEFINRVYESLDAETKAKVDALAAEHYDGNTAVATEEYIASLAETEDFANNSLWEKIKSIFEDIINAILDRNDIKIGDNELRYILRASYNNMVNPRGMESMRVWAQDQMMREEYKINQASPEILSRTGIDPDEIARGTARQVYDYNVNTNWNEFQRQFQDAMQPVRVAIDAIQQATGNVPIEDYENYILVQNQASSRSRVEIDEFSRRYYTPIIEQVNAVIDAIMKARGWRLRDKKKRAQVYAEVRQYLIAKHGLERNAYYQSHNMRKLNYWEKKKETEAAQKEYDDKVDAINADTTLTDAERDLQLRQAQDEFDAAITEINTREVPDLRDYSGLTSLFGMEPKKFREAEEEAEALVNDFEAEAGGVTAEMWKKINAATDKTLRHSYESGMISRQQYNDIKSMFNFYIPLRGFDETTAEDVYSYSRFEGNRFNPAVQTAKGRTSVADDPIAIIMNMAESEIAQGNKNRAKQALYNYLLNRAEGYQGQNSLMQIESVWYVKTVDVNGNEVFVIAAPDHEGGETYEDFENRMLALAAEDKATKSKKGHVDVGMRFQKQQNKNAHYVYLKVNGVDKAIYINGDPKAADAINGVHGKPKGALTEKMGALNRFISSTFTNYSLEFTARNYFRDMLYSHINIGIKESSPAYRRKFRQNWRHNNLRSMIKMLAAYRAGAYENRPLNEDEAAFVEFMQNGGQTGYTVINSVESRKKELQNAIERMQKGLEKGGIKDSTVFKFTLGAIELLNEASELVTRFAAFKTSIDMGRGVVSAIADAKEATVNFNTKGAQDGEGFFGSIARYFGWSKFFFNASVQGVQNIKAMAQANKLKFGLATSGIVATGFLMPILTAAITELFGDDDDEYWNIPEYDRQNNICIVIGNGKYVKIPLPVGFREMYALGDMTAAWMFDKKFTRDGAQVGMDIASKIATVILPINPLESAANGLSFLEVLAYTAAPSSAQFVIQGMTNTDWKGAPLQKEYTYNEDDPQWMKAFKSNPAWMVGLSKWCNEHIGTGDYKGWDWSPEKLDNTLSNIFGGIYSLIKKTGRTISMAWNEEERNLSNIPLAGVIVGSGIDSDERRVDDAYFTEKEYYDDRIGSIKRVAKRFGYDLKDIFVDGEGRHNPKMIKDIYSKKDFDFMQEWYLGHEGNLDGDTEAEVKGLDRMRQDIKNLEKQINKYEDEIPQDLIDELIEKTNEFEAYRRELVEDLMELD